jgi:hypothetical protein
LSPTFGIPKVGKNLKSTTYVMLMGQLCKWLKTCLEVMLTLIVSKGWRGNIISKWSLYLGSSFSSF